MTEPLWQWDELVAAAQARPEGAPAVPATGISIDTRTLQPGDVFVALKDARDGHDFVTQAFAAGAAAAVVANGYARREGDGALLRVAEPLAGLEAIGRAAHALGAGRSRAGESIDHGVGVVVKVKPGGAVRAGDALLEVHHRGGRNLEAALALCEEAIVIGDEPPAPRQKVLGEVR